MFRHRRPAPKPDPRPPIDWRAQDRQVRQSKRIKAPAHGSAALFPEPEPELAVDRRDGAE